MEYLTENKLTNFKFWAGASSHNFTYQELIDIESSLEDIYTEITETEINDLFWFEEEFICKLIGLKYKKYLKR